MTAPASVPQRVPVGISGVDRALGGGLIGGRSYLLAGSAGTGKTIFGLQWLLHGRDAGKTCLYITLAEPSGNVNDNISSFGWSLEGIRVVDLTPSAPDESQFNEDYQIFPSSEVERAPYWQKIYAALDEHRPDHVVLDSMTHLRYLATDEYQFRKNVMQLVSSLHGRKCTSLLIYEPQELARDYSIALAVDGIFHLAQGISQARLAGLRDFQIEKLRGSDYLHGMHPLKISQRGIEVFPHIVEQAGETVPAQYFIPSEIPGLDKLLSGGLESGTTTLATGPSGVGKSTLSSVFARQSVLSRGDRAVYYSFEETRQSLLTRCAGLGIDIDDLLQDGSLKFSHINPLQIYPDEFLARVRQDVEKDGRRFVVIDGLRGYQIAMQEYGTPLAHLHNLTTYLKGQGVTTFMTNANEGLNGLTNEMEMSHLADNIFLMRYAEFEGCLIKVVGCLKKRSGYFEPELRELVLRPGPGGVVIGRVLKDLRGFLSTTRPMENSSLPSCEAQFQSETA